ncbi:MAG TPA: hypothetical protein VFR81_03465 [Longimicrobium sp.]|nr:hypothetical protein [Longimicrobium sp.]
MSRFPAAVTEAELIAFIDRWAELLEREDYQGAFALTGHDPGTSWTPALVAEAIGSYGDAAPGQKVTLRGVPSDVTQRKRVDRWPANDHGSVGGIWYDLNIDGEASDLTATFDLVLDGGGIAVRLDDIHVM